MLFVVLGHSLPFDPPKNPKMKNFDKKKKKCLEVLSLCTCVLQMTIMMYGSWYIKHGRHNFLSFWAVSCPFTPNNPENQHFEKMKKAQGDIIILHKCTINGNHMIYDSWGINCNRHIICHLWPFLALLRYHHFILV